MRCRANHQITPEQAGLLALAVSAWYEMLNKDYQMATDARERRKLAVLMDDLAETPEAVKRHTRSLTYRERVAVSELPGADDYQEWRPGVNVRVP